jgi:hypothetical protein
MPCAASAVRLGRGGTTAEMDEEESGGPRECARRCPRRAHQRGSHRAPVVAGKGVEGSDGRCGVRPAGPAR